MERQAAYRLRWLCVSVALALLVALPASARDIAHPRAFVGVWQCHDALLGWDMELLPDGRARLRYDVEGARVVSHGQWAYEHERLVLWVDGERVDYDVRLSPDRSKLRLSGAELDGAELAFVRLARVASAAAQPRTPQRVSSPAITGSWVARSNDGKRATIYTFREDHTFVRERRRGEERIRTEGGWVLSGHTLELIDDAGDTERYVVRREGERLSLTRKTPQGDEITEIFARSEVELVRSHSHEAPVAQPRSDAL